MSAQTTNLDGLAASTVDTIQRFNEATNRHDVREMMALMTDDVVFENTIPPPDGERREGRRPFGRHGRSCSTQLPARPSRRKSCSRRGTAVSSAGDTAGQRTSPGYRATSAAWTSIACAAAKSPRSSRTSRAEHGCQSSGDARQVDEPRAIGEAAPYVQWLASSGWRTSR